MFCPSCGRGGLSPQTNFCPNCGRHINNGVSSNSSSSGMGFLDVVEAVVVGEVIADVLEDIF